MRKAIKLYIPFFIIVSVLGGIFYGISGPGASDKDSNVSYDNDGMYPEELRPQIAENDDKEVEEELPQEEEELLSDENFVDFEVEKEPETLEETKNTKEPTVSEEDQETKGSETSEETQDTKESKESLDNSQNEEQAEEIPQPEQSSETETDGDMISADQISPDEGNAGDEVEIIPEKVNARRYPESSSKIIAVFEEGQRGVLIKEGDSWSVIKIGEHQGYVSNKFWKRI